MTVETLTTFFGWMAVLNIAYLTLAALALLGVQNWVLGIHQRMFPVDETDLRLAYFTWLGNYKIAAMVFSVVPYVALRLM